MSSKMCDVCGEAPAVVHMTEIENNQVRELDVCQRCAKQRGYGERPAEESPIQDLAEKLMSMAQEVSGRKEVEGIRCNGCGLFYSEFSRTGRLGCPACYEAFMGQLKPILRKTHGSVSHTGRRPQDNQELQEGRRELRRLRGELDRAIRREEYESAATLRDRIQDLESSVRTRTGEEGT